MAKIVTITNGVGTTELINDNYTVEANVVGYDNTSINPSNIQVKAGTNTYSFTISSSGALTLHVTNTGTTEGDPIVGATFVRCDSTGTEYGSPITSDAEGNAVFNNVPYASENAPIIYYKQTASDGDHEFDNTLKQTTLTTQTSTIEVQNSVGATRTINLTDANYTNLQVDGTLTLNN